MKPICSAWVNSYFSTVIHVIDFSPSIIPKLPVQRRPSQPHWANWAGWSQVFSPVWTFCFSDDSFPDWQHWSWKQQLSRSRFRGQHSFLPSWKDIHSTLFVTAGHQNLCHEQRSAKTTQFWYNVLSGPYTKESRLSALKVLLKRLL